LNGLLTNTNENSGEKIKFGPHPPGPWGSIFIFFYFFVVENIRRRSVIVLKFHRGFIHMKKGDINSPKNSETSGPLGGHLYFLKYFF
jgi:hypothetical protein